MGRERNRERNQWERDILTGCLPYSPQPGPGIEAATEVHTLDQDSNLGPFGLQANALITEKPSQGYTILLNQNLNTSVGLG